MRVLQSAHEVHRDRRSPFLHSSAPSLRDGEEGAVRRGGEVLAFDQRVREDADVREAGREEGVSPSTRRVLIVDGPMRGWDVPCNGAFVMFSIPDPPHTFRGHVDEIPPLSHQEARYRVESIRSMNGEVFMLGFLDTDFTYKASKP